MSRPLLVIFLTILVNLIGFGIIIPLLPFYAERFGASPLVIGLLFGVFSICQLIAAPALGDLSDRYGRRPVLIFSLLGTVVSFVMLAMAQTIAMLFLARIVDGLSGGNISTARAYVADITEPKDRARAYGIIGAAFGLGFILGPALSGLLAGVSYTAPIWTAAGLTLVATAMAYFWLPETVHRAAAGTGMPFKNIAAMMQRPGLRRMLVIDFVYWFAFAIFQTTFALFVARRFGFDAPRTGYFCRLRVPGRSSGRSSGRSCIASATSRCSSWACCARRPAWWLRPSRTPSGSGRADSAGVRHRVRAPDGVEPVRPRGAARAACGAAGAVERRGRGLGPVWGNAALQSFGDAMPYLSAAGCIAVTLSLSLTYTVTDSEF